MGQHALELLAIEAPQQPPRDGHRRVLRVAAGGERVQGLVLDDVHRRRPGQAGGDGELLDHVGELGLVVVGDAVRAAGGEHHLVARVVADDAPHDGHDAEHAEQPEAAARVAHDGHPDDEAERREYGDHEPHEQPRGPPVAGDLFVHADALRRAQRRSTVGTSRSPCGASKNCRAVKLNMPAMMLDGNIWILLLYVSTLSL